MMAKEVFRAGTGVAWPGLCYWWYMGSVATGLVNWEEGTLSGVAGAGHR
jgi:hypothetical protein